MVLSYQQQQWHNNPPQNIMYNQEAIDNASQNRFMDMFGVFLGLGFTILAIIIAIWWWTDTMRKEKKRKMDEKSKLENEE